MALATEFDQLEAVFFQILFIQWEIECRTCGKFEHKSWNFVAVLDRESERSYARAKES
jgi:hypothetical protein